MAHVDCSKEVTIELRPKGWVMWKSWGKKQRGQLMAKSVVGASMCFLGSRKASMAVGKLPRDSGMRRAGRGTQGLESRVGNLLREPVKDLSRRVA